MKTIHWLRGKDYFSAWPGLGVTESPGAGYARVRDCYY